MSINIAYIVPIVTFSVGFLIGFMVMAALVVVKGRDE